MICCWLRIFFFLLTKMLLHLPCEILVRIASCLNSKDRSFFCHSHPCLRDLLLVPVLAPTKIAGRDLEAGYTFRELASRLPQTTHRTFLLTFPEDVRVSDRDVWKEVVLGAVRGLARKDYAPLPTSLPSHWKWMEECAGDVTSDAAFLRYRSCETLFIEEVPACPSHSSCRHQLSVLALAAYLIFAVYREALDVRTLLVSFELAFGLRTLDVLKVLTSVVRVASSYDIRIYYDFVGESYKDFSFFTHTGSYPTKSVIGELLLEDRTISSLPNAVGGVWLSLTGDKTLEFLAVCK